MKTFNLDIDYKRTPEQVEKTSNVALTQDYLEYVVNQKFPTLQGQKLRIWGRLQRKIDEAVAATGVVELETAELDFLKEAFKEPSFQTSLAKYVMHLIDAVDKLLED